MEAFLEPKFSGRGKAPRRMVAKKKVKNNEFEASGDDTVEATALGIYLVCGAIGCGLIVRQVLGL